MYQTGGYIGHMFRRTREICKSFSLVQLHIKAQFIEYLLLIVGPAAEKATECSTSVLFGLIVAAFAIPNVSWVIIYVIQIKRKSKTFDNYKLCIIRPYVRKAYANGNKDFVK